MTTVTLSRPVGAATPADFFEARIRPVLVEKCGKCHASTLPSPKGKLVLDTKAGMRAGGASGPVLVPGKPNDSLLIKALRYTDPDVEMPPAGKLPDAVIADFERWIAGGALDSRPDTPAGAPVAKAGPGMPIAKGRTWWAFQPLKTAAAATTTPIDSLIHAALSEKKLSLSQPADKRTLVQRAYVDLLGFKPTYTEVQAFVRNTSKHAYKNLIDRLLASPHYGERWGRHWMDVARYGDDNPTTEATNQPYRFAWRYRDWIVEAVNADVPYPRFIQMQLAADLMPDTKRDDLRALGFLGAAPVYHKDQRLSVDIIGGFATDDWDERVDVVSRGILGLSVACARCHDHKFDPIEQKDYYGLMGVFASTTRAERPLFEVPPAIEIRYLAIQRRLLDLRYSLNLLIKETTTFSDIPARKARWTAEIERLRAEATSLLAPYPKLIESLVIYWAPPPMKEETVACIAGTSTKRPRAGSTEPFADSIFEAATYVEAEDPTYTFLVYKPGEARDMPLLRGGNYGSQGPLVPRHFPIVLTKDEKDDGRLVNGSGRLDLAKRLFTDSQALAARVIVNRVWGWHFGRPLVPTASDFGTQGDKPTHPALLDDLSARFVQNGWSLKWLHREIMLSATYQQASLPRADSEAVDPGNALLWRMNPQRLGIEAYRDSLLRAAGTLETSMGGVPGELEGDTFFRRSLYGRISRGRPGALLALFDFPGAVQTSPGRDQTLTTLQQIYMMNNVFVRDLGVRIVAGLKTKNQAANIQALFRQILARDPTAAEQAQARAYLKNGTLARYAQILLSTNEMVFQP